MDTITLEQYVEDWLKYSGIELRGITTFDIYKDLEFSIENDVGHHYKFDATWENAVKVKKLIDDHFHSDY